MDAGVMSGAHLHRARVEVGGVDVVVVDQPRAGTGGVTKEDVDDAVVTG